MRKMHLPFLVLVALPFLSTAAPVCDPRIFSGDETTAYRDPAAVWHNGTLHLYFTVVTARADGRIYSYVAHSSSRDLRAWAPPVRLTKLDQSLNFSSPGNVIRVGDGWAMCVSSYPRPGYRTGDPVRYGDATARVWLMRSKDLVAWDEPEVMRVKGEVPVADMGRMIDPYLIEDAAEPGMWWCFYKQNGASRSWSRDLRHWTPAGSAPAGENVCILREKDGYVMFHSPQDGIGVKRSSDLLNWRDEPALDLPRDGWDWAKGRLTAGFVLDLRHVPQVGRYVLFFHGSGPKDELSGDFDRNSSVAMLFSDDLRTWRCEPTRWQWITPDAPPEDRQSFIAETTFTCPQDLSRAVLRQTSLGVAETFVNGRRVGDVELKPGFTCAQVRQFHVDDVTSLLVPGEENRLEVEVSDAYWRDLISGQPNFVHSRTNGYAAELVLDRTDGERTVVGTGKGWRTSWDAALVSGGIYEGEMRDGTRTARVAWHPAKTFDPHVTVVPPAGEARIRRDLVRHAEVPFVVRPGERKVVDFGQNAAAREAFTVRGAHGTRLEIRHAEVLNPDGTCYFGNLRRTTAMTSYVLTGKPSETFRPRHTYYGFRYVEISVSAPVEFQTLDFEPVTSVRDETGRITTSDPDLNRLISCAEWSIRSNQLSVPTDCCNRGERLGWMGDALVSVPAACWLWDTRSFYLDKVARDQRDLQAADGRYCSLSPGRGGELGEDKYGIVAWSDAGVLIPHAVYRHFGRADALAAHWPSMRRYGDWLEKNGGPVPGYWGDWLSFERTGYGEPRYPYGSDPDTYAFLAAAYRWRDFKALSELAAALGLADEARRFGLDATAALADVRRRFFACGRLLRAYACQTTYAMALNWGFCPDAESRRLTTYDLELNVIRSGRRQMTGVLGTPHVLAALAENGKVSLAYDLLLNRACPSWLYMVERGATSLWERWDGILSDGGFNDPAMNSFNHADFACVLDWMYRTMAGIRPGECGSWERIVLSPRPDPRIRKVEASYRSPKGMVRVKSEYAAEGGWSYDYELPDGVEAELRLPDGRVLPRQTGKGHQVLVAVDRQGGE